MLASLIRTIGDRKPCQSLNDTLYLPEDERDEEMDGAERGRKSARIAWWGDTTLCLCVTFMEKSERGSSFVLEKPLCFLIIQERLFPSPIPFSVRSYSLSMPLWQAPPKATR